MPWAYSSVVQPLSDLTGGSWMTFVNGDSGVITAEPASLKFAMFRNGVSQFTTMVVERTYNATVSPDVSQTTTPRIDGRVADERERRLLQVRPVLHVRRIQGPVPECEHHRTHGRDREWYSGDDLVRRRRLADDRWRDRHMGLRACGSAAVVSAAVVSAAVVSAAVVSAALFVSLALLVSPGPFVRRDGAPACRDNGATNRWRPDTPVAAGRRPVGVPGLGGIVLVAVLSVRLRPSR